MAEILTDAEYIECSILLSRIRMLGLFSDYNHPALVQAYHEVAEFMDDGTGTL